MPGPSAVVSGAQPTPLTSSPSLISCDWQDKSAPADAGNTEVQTAAAYKLTEEDFKAETGVDPELLPDGVAVKDLAGMHETVQNAPPDTLPAGVSVSEDERQGAFVPAAAAAGLRSPAAAMSFIPPNCTGILWVEAGHISVFSNVEGQLTIRGFRGEVYNYILESFPKIGKRFTERINTGIEGAFRNDWFYAKLPGQQTVIYVPTDRDAAEAFRDHLIETEYNQEYRYSPPRPNESVGGGSKVGRKEQRLHDLLKEKMGEARLVQCVDNCTTVPAREFEEAIGMRPQVETPTGTLDIVTGRTEGGEPNPYEAGRAARTRDWAANADLSKAKPGARRIRMTAMPKGGGWRRFLKPGATEAMFVIRSGGTLMLVIGGADTLSNLYDAWGTGHFGEVAALEAAGWGGGFAAGEVAGAISETVGRAFLVAGGEETLLFVVGSTGFGLVVAYFGSKIAGSIVENIIAFPDRVKELIAFTGQAFEAMESFSKQTRHGITGLFIRPHVVTLESVNPMNWHLRNLGAAESAVRALGAAAWSKLPMDSLDDFRDESLKTFAQLGVDQNLVVAVAQMLTGGGSPVTFNELLAMRPIDYVRFLRALGDLEFIRDPEMLADQQVYEEGPSVNETMLNVRAAPLVERRARINPNNWNLDALGARAEDVLDVGNAIWTRLRGLKFDEFDEASEMSMSKLGVTEQMLVRAARVMLKSRDFAGNLVAGAEPVPEEMITEYARGLIGGDPNDFVRALEEQLHLTFRTEPSAIAAAALVWMRAGYQAW